LSIKGRLNAYRAAVDRANRMKQSICIVQIGQDEYVLWREITISALPYQHYRIIATIRTRDDIR